MVKMVLRTLTGKYMIWSVHYLRGVAALFVVLYHVKHYVKDVCANSNLGDILFGWGFFGVDIFFMISGFVIAISTQHEKSKVSFIVKRFFRIYPLYFFSLVLSVIVLLVRGNSPVADIFKAMLKSMFFLHLDYTGNAPFFGYSVNYPGWTLTYEMMFYGVFFVALCISNEYRSFICAALLAVLCLMINLAFNNLEFSVYSSIDYTGGFAPVFKVLSSPMMMEFIAGIILFYIYLFLKKYKFLLRGRFVFLINSVFFLFSIMLIVFKSPRYHGLFNIGIGCFFLLLSCVVHELSGRSTKNSLLLFFGNISYSLYITHAFSISVFESSLYLNELHGVLKLVAVMILAIAFAFFVHKSIEMPMVAFGKNLLKKRNNDTNLTTPHK